MITPEKFKQIRAYCHSKAISFYPDDDKSKATGVQALVLTCNHTGDRYPECETVEQVRMTVSEIARRRALKAAYKGSGWKDRNNVKSKMKV